MTPEYELLFGCSPMCPSSEEHVVFSVSFPGELPASPPHSQSVGLSPPLPPCYLQTSFKGECRTNLNIGAAEILRFSSPRNLVLDSIIRVISFKGT